MSIKVLYVEDELFLGKIVKETLESRGFDVTMETDGDKVVPVFGEVEPDICVLDIMLPNKNGFDIAEDISDLMFMKYREIGLDTPEKRKCYPILVREIQDSIHDVYLRALNGKERDSIRKRWNLNEQVGSPIGNLQQGGGSRLSPRNWLR